MPGEERPARKSHRQAIKCHAVINFGKRKGEPCPFWAMEGQLVCRRHGGKAPQALAAAAVRIAEKKARAILAQLDVQPVGNALEELGRVAGQIVAWKDVCAGMVNDLGEELRYGTPGQGEQLRSEIVLWERSLDRCVNVLSAIARLNIDDRLAVIKEREAELIAKAFAASLDMVPGLDDDHKDYVRRDFTRRLRALPPGA